MRFVSDWKQVLKHAWSVKFTLLAAVLAGIEAFNQFFIPMGIPNGWFAMMAGIVSMLAPLARVVAQKEITNAPDPAPAPK